MLRLALPSCPASPDALAGFLKHKLVPALDPALTGSSDGTGSASTGALERLEGVVVDVVWQIDQDIDCAMLDLTLGKVDIETATTETQAMDVDQDSDAVKAKDEAEVAAASAKRSLEAQLRIADFTKWLIVSSDDFFVLLLPYTDVLL